MNKNILIVVFGIVLVCGGVYFVAHRQTPSQAVPGNVAAREHCLFTAKNKFLAGLEAAGISCPSDSLGWPDALCVQKTKAGAQLYATLYDEDNVCFNKN